MSYTVRVICVRIRRIFKRIGLVFLVLALLLSGMFIYYNGKMRPTVKTMAVSRVQDIATRIIHETVESVLPKYGSIAVVKEDSDGHIRAVSVDTASLNLYKSDVALEVLDRLERVSDEAVISFPLGTLAGVEILSALGPNVDVRLLPVTSVFCDTFSSFESVGINQTRHRVYLQVTVTATVVLPTETAEVVYTVDTVCAETVILGEVPDIYADIK